MPTPAQVAQINQARAANVAAGKSAYSGAGATATNPGTPQPAQAPANIPGAQLPQSPNVSGAAPQNVQAPSDNPQINTAQPNPATTNINPPNNPAIDQAMQNIASTGYTPPAGTDAAVMAQYQKAKDALKDKPMPTDAGTAKGIASQSVKDNASAPTSNPVTDNFFQENEGVKGISKDTIDFLSPPSERDTLREHLDALNTDKTALAGLKTDLMNTKRIMAGTEQDIRDEITKANGFATNSQVMALTIARNRSLQTQATFLQDQIQTQQDLVANDTSLVGEDKTLASQGFTQRMALLNYQQKNTENMMSAAKSGLDAVVKASGYAGLYAAVKDDPTQMARDEQVLGLAPGGLANLATTPDLANMKTKLEIQKLQDEVGQNIPGTQSYNKNQDKLEGQYRTVLAKELSNRSGGIGIQDAKVNQAIHLRALVDKYKDKDGNYNIPSSQYAELAMGLATLISPGNSAESDRQAILAHTAKGDLNGALQYITGTPQNGNTQDVITNLVDSIDRQGSVAESLRDQGVSFLKGLVPTGLDESRVEALNKNSLASYDTYKNTGQVSGKDAKVEAPKPERVYAPAEIPPGMYQASDGLLYKK